MYMYSVLAMQHVHVHVPSYIIYMYTCTCTMYVCLSGLWLGGLLHLSFLSYFFKLVCYAHVFPCTVHVHVRCMCLDMYIYT